MIRVIGLGNPLMRDDGLGPAAVVRLSTHDLPHGVEVMDGGTPGLALLSLLEGADLAILIDAADMGLPEGTIRRLSLDQLGLTGQEQGRLSLHAADLVQVLELGQAVDQLPGEVLFFLMQPEKIGLGTELSPRIEGALPELVGMVLDELRGRGGVGG